MERTASQVSLGPTASKKGSPYSRKRRLGKLTPLVMVLLLFLASCAEGGEGEDQAANDDAEAEPSEAEAELPDVFKVGALLPLTGPGAGAGERFSRTLEMAVDEINSEGGIDGIELELIIEDHEASGDVGLSAFRKLVDVDDVEYVVTTYTDVTMPIAPVAEREGVLLINPSAASPTLRGLSPNHFSIIDSSEDNMLVELDYAINEMGEDRIGVVTANTEFGIALSDFAESAIGALGGEFVGEVVHDSGATDFSAEISQMQEWDADSVYLATADEAWRVVQQSHERGFNPQWLFYGLTAYPEFTDVAAEAADGILTGTMAFDPESNEDARAFADMWSEGTDLTANNFDCTVYDSIHILPELMQRVMESESLELTGEGLRDALVADPQLDGECGVPFEIDTESGFARRPMGIQQLTYNSADDSGEFGFLEFYEPEELAELWSRVESD